MRTGAIVPGRIDSSDGNIADAWYGRNMRTNGKVLLSWILSHHAWSAYIVRNLPKLKRFELAPNQPESPH